MEISTQIERCPSRSLSLLASGRRGPMAAAGLACPNRTFLGPERGSSEKAYMRLYRETALRRSLFSRLATIWEYMRLFQGPGRLCSLVHDSRLACLLRCSH